MSSLREVGHASVFSRSRTGWVVPGMSPVSSDSSRPWSSRAGARSSASSTNWAKNPGGRTAQTGFPTRAQTAAAKGSRRDSMRTTSWARTAPARMERVIRRMSSP